jgi:ketosteroid isomerase-like protein
MSQANVEAVHRWLEAFSSEDFEAALALVHPDVVLFPPGDQAPHRGSESLRRWMEPDAFQGQVIKLLETVAAADGSIVSKQRAAARGRASGIELDMISWCVWRFDEEGLITRIEIYLTHEEDKARKAAGL